MGDLTGKVAVITGAGRGLGREEAMQLARQGARVVINDINLPDAAEAAQATVEEIKAFGGEAILVLGDCADSNDANTLMKTTLDTYGDIQGEGLIIDDSPSKAGSSDASPFGASPLDTLNNNSLNARGDGK